MRMLPELEGLSYRKSWTGWDFIPWIIWYWCVIEVPKIMRGLDRVNGHTFFQELGNQKLDGLGTLGWEEFGQQVGISRSSKRRVIIVPAVSTDSWIFAHNIFHSYIILYGPKTEEGVTLSFQKQKLEAGTSPRSSPDISSSIPGIHEQSRFLIQHNLYPSLHYYQQCKGPALLQLRVWKMPGTVSKNIVTLEEMHSNWRSWILWRDQSDPSVIKVLQTCHIHLWMLMDN